MGAKIWKPPNDWGRIFADNLKLERLKNSISQKEFAEKIGVTNGAVAMWETDKSKPNLEMLIKICSHFGKTLDEMLFERAGETGDRASPPAAESPPGTEKEKEGMEERIRRLESMMFQKGISAI